MGEKVTPTIAVIVVAYQSESDVERCVASLREARKQTPGLSLWLIDNSVDLDIRKKIKSHLTEPWMHYLYFGENLGFAVGNNEGFKAASAEDPDYYFLLNADAAVEPDCLATLLAEAEERPAAAYGPLMTYADGTVYYAGGNINYWLAATFHSGRRLPPRANDQTRRVSFINGCGLFMPASSYERWGGLSDDYFMYYEEADWCARVNHDRGELYYVPAARLTHYTAKDSASPAALYYLTRNQWLFARRQTRWYHRPTSYLGILIFQTLRFVKHIGNRERRQAILRAWRDARHHHYGQMA